MIEKEILKPIFVIIIILAVGYFIGYIGYSKLIIIIYIALVFLSYALFEINGLTDWISRYANKIKN